MVDGRFVRLDTRDANPGRRFCGDGLTLSHFAAHGKPQEGTQGHDVLFARGQLLLKERMWVTKDADRWQGAEALHQLRDVQAIADEGAHQQDRWRGEPLAHAPSPIARPHTAHAQWC